MKKPLPASLFSKYLSGQCSPYEEALVEQWYSSFEDDDDYTGSISAQQKLQLKDRIRQGITGTLATTRLNTAPGYRAAKVAWITAASIAASLLIFFVVLKHKPAIVKNTTVANLSITFSNTTKAIAENTLSDGSHVWMMPGATLIYHKYFSANSREVNLCGEAFFEVTKNPKRPFIIYSRNLITKVWGTSFRVRDSKELSFADVTVLTGKVSVKLINAGGEPKDEVMIYPSQQVTYQKKEKIFARKPDANMTAMAIWKKPDMSFNDRPLREVIPALNKFFQLKITVSADKINDLLLTADLNGLNFPEIMQMLHKALDINYDINGQHVSLKTNDNQ